MPVLPERMQSGMPYPLGATCDGMGTNFAVFSAHAERIELCLFDPSGKREIARYDLPECTDEVWHGYLPRVRGGTLYGFRAHGPYAPEEGHRFNPNKLLLDPYARLLHGQVRWSDALHGYRVSSPRADLSFDRRDSAAAMPKAVVVDEPMHWTHGNRPHTPWNETVIYETHLKGFTRSLKRIRQHERGTFIALADPYVIDYLVKLGVTAVELLPVHAYLQDRRLTEMKLRNYWGYNTLAFFAPEPAYLAEGALNEIRAAVQALHAAGIEVILDVVYNHTCEGSELGTTMSFRGLDNKSYYRLMPDNPRYCINDTGTGNTVNTAHPRVLQLVMDSLRYWVQTFHVDGFRFDLGVSLGREEHGFDPNCGLFDAMRQDPVLANVKLISEPWDIGPGGYQLGNHPPGFAEWNGKYRDDIRRFWKGDANMRGALAGRLQASGELFDHQRRKPWASVNFITAHDGFTLEDLVSYNDKHNEANGEDNRDGGNDNESYNYGAEGPTDDQGIRTARDRVKRSMLATMFFSHGTPMLLGGDEFGRTQHGNNNAYCQDNELSWYDWKQATSEQGRELADFTARLIRLREQHPTLRAAHFLRGDKDVVPGMREVAWFDERGTEMDQEAWGYTEGRLLALRRVQAQGEKRADVTLVLFNATPEMHVFTLPQPAANWRLCCNTASPTAPEVAWNEPTIEVEGRCVVMLAATVRTEPA
ncbi:glycogen debranching protein GlgX [Luteibacter sp. UNCMF366Tsu5.1]|uniref:glycogen debranching protein GlgX n=1 Tax=Luteibacter sp. UNCMF366Tsu5.1 TaxID=1502758 RepID=UPI000908F239|nr:glycogen debranching protein GlgX [Luteibacter sp. UNCMF366Tsu5.1]SFW17995.1 glycogen operon protein [Luteibacter sp. UNCMF366Tsu5.1]